MATAKAEIPPAKGNQINDWPGRVRSVTGPFNFDPGPWSAIAFIILVSYNKFFSFQKCIVRIDSMHTVHLRQVDLNLLSIL
jgi:hypothetical protein